MARSWTFGQKLAAGFAALVALSLLSSVITVLALRAVVESKDRVIAIDAHILLDAQELDLAMEAQVSAMRGYLLARGEASLTRMEEERGEVTASLERLKKAVSTDEGRRLLAAIERDQTAYQGAIADVVALRRGDAPMEAVIKAFDEQAVPRRNQLRTDVEAFVAEQERLLEAAKQASTDTASEVISFIGLVALVLMVMAVFVAVVLTRALGRQIGSAVAHVQSSASELHTSANQQATGLKEQATAMNEITTTISELLTTSKQIAESAQRVAQIAEDTAKAARAGEHTVATATDSIGSIKRQVDLIVTHMLDLGKKSQQIGGILEIINELAEQTNILAINATIEAAGAGDAGKRFAVVADEIRKLADRVGHSTKEIRGLIDDVRAAVNTTVMTTEGGTKAVDLGARQFSDVATSFKQIASLVSTTTQAAREIELSTKQQSTAVEQVNIAVANVAQTTKETETSAGQTFQTASQLKALSFDLMRLIQPEAGA